MEGAGQEGPCLSRETGVDQIKKLGVPSVLEFILNLRLTHKNHYYLFIDENFEQSRNRTISRSQSLFTS